MANDLFGVIPDMLIVRVADQYLSSATIVRSSSAASKVPLPIVNSAIIAVELYLKSLNAITVYSKLNDPDGFRQLHSKALYHGHNLADQYEDLDWNIRHKLDHAWQDAFEFRFERGTLGALLKEFDGVFQKTRYPFEEKNSVDGVNIGKLLALARFMRDFIYENEEEFFAWSSKM